MDNNAGAGSNDTDHQSGSVVNWSTPSKYDVVSRALSDGMTDPVAIIKWAKNYNVDLTVQEVDQLATQYYNAKAADGSK